MNTKDGIQLTVEQLEKASDILRAISHPMRLAIIDFLTKQPGSTVSEIYETLNIDQSIASHHLGILKDKGILESKRKGKNIHYSLRMEKISSIITCIGSCLE